MAQTSAKSPGDTKGDRLDLRRELERLEKMIAELQVQYEQFFLGITPIMPDKLHNQVKRQIKTLMRAPFRTSAINFKLRSLESRYHTLNNRWQKTIKQKEEGTYFRDVFKAELREKALLEEAKAQTAEGKTERSLVALFNSYKSALEKQTGSQQDLDYQRFKKSIIQRAKDFKQKNGTKKLSFKVVVANGKVKVKAKSS